MLARCASRFPALFVAVLSLLLAACAADERIVAGKRVETRWAERQLLFVGDDRTGLVRVFHLRAAPLLVGELRAPGRAAVRGIAVDGGRGRIWVLADAAVYLHDARSYALVRRIPLPSAAVTQLVLDAAGVPLLQGGDGETLARIDTSILAVESLQLAGR
jgi:hypothetical protein